MNDANRLRRPSIEVRRELNEVANCFLEVQNANTVFKAWETKLILGQIVESDRTNLEYLDTRKNDLGNDIFRTNTERTLNSWRKKVPSVNFKPFHGRSPL